MMARPHLKKLEIVQDPPIAPKDTTANTELCIATALNQENGEIEIGY